MALPGKTESELWDENVDLRTQLEEAKGCMRRDAKDIADLQGDNAALQADNERLQQWVSDLQGRMYINCVYCGHRYGPDDEEPEHDTMQEELRAHVEQCPKHPMSALKADYERLRVEVADTARVAGELGHVGTANRLRAALAQPNPNPPTCADCGGITQLLYRCPHCLAQPKEVKDGS